MPCLASLLGQEVPNWLPSHWTFFGGHPISANGISFPNNNIPAKMETWLLFTHVVANPKRHHIGQPTKICYTVNLLFVGITFFNCRLQILKAKLETWLFLSPSSTKRQHNGQLTKLGYTVLHLYRVCTIELPPSAYSTRIRASFFNFTTLCGII